MPQPKLHPTAAAKQAAYRARLAEQKDPIAEAAIPLAPGVRRWKAMRSQAAKILAELIAEQTAYAEAKSERWQESEAGESHAERIQQDQEALDTLEA